MGACAGKHKRIHKKYAVTRTNFRLPSSKTRSLGRFVNEEPPRTTLYDLPMEMLDIILQKSYLHWVLNPSTEQRDEEVIRALISVDVCFNRRITRQRFKKAIWCYLKVFYGKTKRRYAVIRNNRDYLMDNIQPNAELISSLLSLNCLTEHQSHFIQQQRSMRYKNDKLLYIMESFNDTSFSDCVKCLRRTNQKAVAKIIENGGGAIKMLVQTQDRKCTSMETHLLHKNLKATQNETRIWSHPTDELAQRREKGIEILNSYLDRQNVVVWIWCHSQTALEHVHMLYDSNQLRYVFFKIIGTSISNVINIDRTQFKKTFVFFQICISLTQRIEIRATEYVIALTKLQNRICVLCQSKDRDPNVIRVFEDQTPFRIHKEIEIEMIESPEDIGSSEKENCLYICDLLKKCIWKITGERDDQCKTIKWLTTDYEPRALSVSNHGQVLMVNDILHSLMIYGSDAELVRLIVLPRDIKDPRYSVETSIGTFIIIHFEEEEEEEEEDDSSEEWKHKELLLGTYGLKESSGSTCRRMKMVLSELTVDGQTVLSRFIPSNEIQQLNHPVYLSLDLDDRVFVADTDAGRVILLDSRLEWNRILCPTKEEKEEKSLPGPWRLCYDGDMKQLIVGKFMGRAFNIYTLSLNLTCN